VSPSILPRVAAAAVERALSTAPVVVLLGARQTGKTTLVRSMPQLSGRPYLTLDDFDLRTQAAEDPESVVRRAPFLVLDEVQRTRDLLIAVKRAVDDDPDRTPGRFVLTGSANLLMLERVSETLAGRAVYVTLWPFTRRERLGQGCTGAWSGLLSAPFERWHGLLDRESGPKEDWRDAARAGGLPVPSRELPDDEARALWFSGYVQTYLERDVRAVTAVRDLVLFRRFLALLASRHAQVLNKTDLAAPLGVSVPTIGQWLGVLETTAQILIVPPFYENFGKRLIKSPKIYVADAGLACHLLGIDTAGELARSPFRGALFEGFIAAEMAKAQVNAGGRRELYYFRDEQGLEVDFLVPGRAGAVALVECKAVRTVTPGMVAPMQRLAAALKRTRGKAAGTRMFLVHQSPQAGTPTPAVAPGVRALPWQAFLEAL